jgi:hypothetical protein
VNRRLNALTEESEMNFSHGGREYGALGAESNFLRIVTDYGPLTGQYLATQEAREHLVQDHWSGAGRTSFKVRPVVISACRRLGAACIALGMQWKEAAPIASVLVHPGDRNAV